MRGALSNAYLVIYSVMLSASLITGCQTGNTDRPINIESDSGSGDFYSGEKTGGNDSDASNGQSTDLPEGSCPGAPPQRVQIGDRAVVSTISDRLIVRKDGNKNSTEIARIRPGTLINIIGGPKCDDANGWTYWKIETDNGLTGWVSEGGDDIDAYFISPLD